MAKGGFIIILTFLAVFLLLSVSYFYFGDSVGGFISTGFATTSSQVGNLSVGVETYMACTWSNDALNVSFGQNQDPGNNGTNATGNYNITVWDPNNGTTYNVTLADINTANADLEILGADLYSGANFFLVENVSYDTNATNASGINMIYENSVAITNSYVDMETNQAAGTDIHFRFWLDVPIGTVAGTYVGNYTQRCSEA
jgi:hypothetical protein